MFELYLNAAGTLLEKTTPTLLPNGHLVTLRNYPVRSVSWRLEFVCCDSCRGNLAISDERGQVFLLSVDDNEYRLIRKASSPISCLAFVLSQPHHLLIAYENGELLTIDTISGNVIKLISNSSSSPQRHRSRFVPCIRLLRTHPTLLLAVSATDDVNQATPCISLWDMSRPHEMLRCLRRLPCDRDDGVVDVQFELGGLALCVVLQRAGACLYRSTDCSLAVQCAWPRGSSNSSSSSKHRPKRTPPVWTAYASIPTPDDEGGMRVVLAGDDGSIHVWEQVNKVMFLPEGSCPSSTAGGAKAEAGSVTVVVHLATILQPCLGVLEMVMMHSLGLVPPPLSSKSSSSSSSSSSYNAGGAMMNDRRKRPMHNHSTTALHTNSSTTAAAVAGGGAERMTIISMVLMAGGDNGSGSGRGDSSSPSPRLAMLTSCGRAMVVEIEGVSEAQGCVGLWTVLADWSAAEIQGPGPGPAGVQGIQLPAFSLPRKDTSYSDQPSSSQPPPPPLSLSPCSSSSSNNRRRPPPNLNQSNAPNHQIQHQCHPHLGWMAVARIPRPSPALAPVVVSDMGADGDMPQPLSLCVVGADGALRWLDVDAAIGHGMGAGQALPVREEVGEMGVLLGAVLGLGAREDDQVARAAEGRSSHSHSHSHSTIPGGAGGGGGAGSVGADHSSLGSLSLAQALVQRRRDQQQQQQQQQQSQQQSQQPAAAAAPPPQLPSPLLSQPLFDFAAENHQVTAEKLRLYLHSHPGGFPSRYRPMLWRLLLRLPENAAELASFSLRGTHPAYRLMHREYPVGGDHRLFLRLQAVCSNLAHWTPLLAEATYLPAMVYPFVLVFGSDEVAATETVMTLLLWWGHSWMATHPHPPVHVTDGMDALLRLHDPPLHAHLHSLTPAASPGLLGWSLLSSLFTHLLPRQAWLAFVDFLFAHIEHHSALALLAPVALLHGLREDLLAAPDERAVMARCHCHARVVGAGCSDEGDDGVGDGSEEGEVFRGRIDMEAVRATLLSWLDPANTPPEYLTAVGPLSEGSDQGKASEEHKDKGSTAPSSASVMHACVNRSCGRALLYLPPLGERYPAFEGLPRPTHDWQIAQREQLLGKGAEASAETISTTSGAGAGAGARPPLTLLGTMAIDSGVDSDLGYDQEEHRLTTTNHPSTTSPRVCQEEEERQQTQLLLAARRLAVQEQELAAAIAAEERMWEARLRQEEGLLALRRAERAAELDRDRALVAMQTDMAHRLARLREERDEKVGAFERARCGCLAVEDQEARLHAMARQKLLAEKEELTHKLRCGQGLGLGLGSFMQDGETTPMDGSLAILTTTTAATRAIATTSPTTAAGVERVSDKGEKELIAYPVVAPSVVLPPEVAASEVAPPPPPVDRSRDSFQVAMRRDRDRSAANRAASGGGVGDGAGGGGGGVSVNKTSIVGGGGVVSALKKDKGKASAVNHGGVSARDDLLIATSNIDSSDRISSDSSVLIISASDVSRASSPPPLPLTSSLPPPPPSSPLSPASSSPSSTRAAPLPPPPPSSSSSGSVLLEEIKSFRGTFDFTSNNTTKITHHPPIGRNKPWIRTARPAQGPTLRQGLAIPPPGSGLVCESSSLPRDTVTGVRTRANLFGPSPRPRSAPSTGSRRGGGRASANPPWRGDTGGDEDKGAAIALTQPKPKPTPNSTHTRAASTTRPTRTSRPVPPNTSAQAPITSTPMAASTRRQPFIVSQPRPHSQPRPSPQPRATTSRSESPPQTPLRADNSNFPSRQPIRIDLPTTSPYPQQGLGQGIGTRQGLGFGQGQVPAQGQRPAFSRDHPSPTRRLMHVSHTATTSHTNNGTPSVPPYTSPSRQGLARARSRPSPDHTKWTQSLRLSDEGAAATAVTSSPLPSRPRPPFVVDISLAPDPDLSPPHAFLRGSKTHYDHHHNHNHNHHKHPDDPVQPPPLAPLVGMVRVGACQLPPDWTPFMGVM